MEFSRQEFLELIAISFSRGSSQPRDQTQVSHIAGRHFTIWATREAHSNQVYAPTMNAEEAEVEWFYEDLQDILELTPKKGCPFHYRELECKSWSPLMTS